MEDLTGRIFGKLTVLELAEWKNGTSYWHCRCEFGNETIVRYVYLINGHIKEAINLYEEMFSLMFWKGYVFLSVVRSVMLFRSSKLMNPK